MNRLLIAGLGVALLTLAGCATTGTSSSANASAGVPWEADESTLPAIGPFESAWAVDDSTLPAIDEVKPFTDFDPLPN